MRRLLLAVALLTATSMIGMGCDSGTPPGPDPDLGLPPMDVNDGDVIVSTDTSGDATSGAGIYAGTCLEAVASCFDFVAPCTQTSTDDGFLATSASGATFDVSIGGASVATASDGTECFTAEQDPVSGDVTFTAPSGTYQETMTPSGRQITCPDGSTDSAPGDLVPWDAAYHC
jgi:hypothetical protein